MPAAELTEREIMQSVERAGAEERISPFDPDFVLMIVFALIVDVLDALILVLQIITVFTIGEVVSVVFDLFILGVVGLWIYWRTGKIAESKRQRVTALKKTAEKRVTGMQRQLTRGIQSPLRRVFVRGGIAFLGEIIPFLGLIPFWTIAVILTIREK